MAFVIVALSSFAVGFSGALMPGPLLGLTIDIGLKKGIKGGLLLAVGHSLLDLLTLTLLVLGLKEIISMPIISAIIGIVGGLILTNMGFSMFLSAYKNKISLNIESHEMKNTGWRKLLLKGAAVSISNPYYLLWWSSVGLALVLNASYLGFMGIALVYIGHIAADIIWCCFVAYTMHKSHKIMSPKVYKGIILGIGVFVAVFGLFFIYSGSKFIV